jgi:hypothetical protein
MRQHPRSTGQIIKPEWTEISSPRAVDDEPPGPDLIYAAAADRAIPATRYAGRENRMHVALMTTFAVTKKEPLAVLLEQHS